MALKARPLPFRQTRTARWMTAVLLVPEAVVLVALLLMAQLVGVHPWLGFVALATIAVFGVRMALLIWADNELARGAYAPALRVARLAERLNPWSVDTLALEARALALQGDDQASETVLRRALAIRPDDPALQAALVTALLSQGRVSESWHAAVTGDGSAPQVAHQQAWFALHIENDPLKARALLQTIDMRRLALALALPIQTTFAETLVALGSVAEARRQIDTVLARLERCGRPQQAELLFHIGKLQEALGDDASAAFRRSVALDPNGRYAQQAWRSAVAPDRSAA